MIAGGGLRKMPMCVHVLGGLVAVELDIRIDVCGALAEAALEDNHFIGMRDGIGHSEIIRLASRPF